MLPPPPVAPAPNERLEDGAAWRWHCLQVQDVSLWSLGWPSQQSGASGSCMLLHWRLTSLVPTIALLLVPASAHTPCTSSCTLPTILVTLLLYSMTSRRSFAATGFALFIYCPHSLVFLLLLKCLSCVKHMGHSPSSSWLTALGFKKSRLFHCNLTGQGGQRWDKDQSTSTEKWLLSRPLSAPPESTALGLPGRAGGHSPVGKG